MRLVAAAVLSLGIAFAPAVSAATNWQGLNTCWKDFDVGGGYVCGLMVTGAGGCNSFNNGVYCSGKIQPTVLPYKNLPPVSKLIAVDTAGYVYLVGNDNKIYYENPGGNDWLLFPGQPNMCIQKLVAIGDARSNRGLLVLGCAPNHEVKVYFNATWTHIAWDGQDVSVFQNGTSPETFSYLSSDYPRSLYTGGSTTWSFTQSTGSTYVNYTDGGGHTQSNPTSLIAGVIGYQDTFSLCSGGGLPQSPLWTFWGPYVLPYGPDPSGCTYLQLPSGGFDASHSPFVTKMVQRRGNITTTTGGQAGLWILTNFARLYAWINQ
jgi:hypothetical protein